MKSFLIFFVSLPVYGFTPNTVTTGSSLMRVEAAIISNSGTPTVAYETSDWLAVPTDNGSGDTTLVINNGVFGVAPACTCSVINATAAGNTRTCNFLSTPTTTAARALTDSATDTAGTTGVARVDNDFSVFCMGHR